MKLENFIIICNRRVNKKFEYSMAIFYIFNVRIPIARTGFCEKNDGCNSQPQKQLFQGVSKLTESNKNQLARIVNSELTEFFSSSMKFYFMLPRLN
ncbi:hypothetical protein DERF_002136 [Dermatophagoides farinae]|uniref:Uncharacterized protein n=1 Tax=Dermatophagoides farinae TaxID=6954 RepID=A0A922ICC9_DERFA|nr:hypothetical protein DERF_002136 [Dermatophagoides farinae]